MNEIHVFTVDCVTVSQKTRKQTEKSILAGKKGLLARFRKPLLALDADDAKKQIALFKIFKTFPNTDGGGNNDPFEEAVTALTNYAASKNESRIRRVCVFCKVKQESYERISVFHTRLRRLAMTC